MKINFETGECRMKPTYALVLHQREVAYGRVPDGELVTIHQINDENELGAPRVIDPDRLASFMALAGIRGNSGAFWIHERLLAIGPKSVVWFVPAAMREMFFRNQALNAISGKRMPNPPLAFIAGDGELKVFALAENKRPDAKTPLFLAPFLNVYNNGNICLPGNSRGAIKADFTKIDQFEHIFFDSFGSHLNGDVVKYRGGHDALWLHLAKSGETEFKSEWLKPYDHTLGEVIK